MTIVLQLYERNKVKAENFAYVNVKLDKINSQVNPMTQQEEHTLLIDEKVISNNKSVGQFVSFI